MLLVGSLESVRAGNLVWGLRGGVVGLAPLCAHVSLVVRRSFLLSIFLLASITPGRLSLGGEHPVHVLSRVDLQSVKENIYKLFKASELASTRLATFFLPIVDGLSMQSEERIWKIRTGCAIFKTW